MNTNTEALPPDTDETTSSPHARPAVGPRPLYRPFQDRMLAGVAAGIAEYLGADATIVRIALAVLTVLGGAGVPLYIAGWLLIPEEGATQSIASDIFQSLSSRSSQRPGDY